MPALTCQIVAPPGVWRLVASGGLETVSQVTTGAAITVRYGASSLAPDDTIPALAIATDPTTGLSTFDHTIDIWLLYTTPGTGKLYLALESAYIAQTIAGNYAILGRVLRDRVTIWQQA